MNVPVIKIDLNLPCRQRWAPIKPFAAAAREICTAYVQDLGGLARIGGVLEAYGASVIERERAEEIDAVAGIIGLSPEEVLAANLYYDAVKVVLGCTAFAVDASDGPLHARNLDWWSDNAMLARHTVIMDYSRDGAGTIFRSVGWPGFIGVLSGMAPGRFAVTLNAVSSNEPPGPPQPVTLLLRSVLETASDFGEAVTRLSSEAIVSDCLLLVSGIRQGEMVVIERTPTRSAVRRPEGDHVVVTNDYRNLTTQPPWPTNLILSTTCGRYDRAMDLLKQLHPSNSQACFEVLTDPLVRMGITMQHMVMSAARNALEVRLPDS